MSIIMGSSFVYRGWVGSMSKNLSGKYVIKLMAVDLQSQSVIEHTFKVSPHWYDNEDWEKAGRMAQQYIDTHIGDAPSIPFDIPEKRRLEMMEEIFNEHNRWK